MAGPFPLSQERSFNGESFGFGRCRNLSASGTGERAGRPAWSGERRRPRAGSAALCSRGGNLNDEGPLAEITVGADVWRVAVRGERFEPRGGGGRIQENRVVLVTQVLIGAGSEPIDRNGRQAPQGGLKGALILDLVVKVLD